MGEPNHTSRALCGRTAGNRSETKLSKTDKSSALLPPGGFRARFCSPRPLTPLQPEARSFPAGVSSLLPAEEARLGRGRRPRLSPSHGTDGEERRGAGRGFPPAFPLARPLEKGVLPLVFFLPLRVNIFFTYDCSCHSCRDWRSEPGKCRRQPDSRPAALPWQRWQIFS